MQGNLYPFDLISTSMLNVQPEGKKTLYNLYSTHRDAFKALPRTPFGKYDHYNYILLIPAYKPNIKAGSSSDSVKKNGQIKQMLSYRTVLLAQTGICSRDSSDGIEEYTTSVTGFINKCIDDIAPTVTVHTYPNQKPWITGNIRTELKGRSAAFQEQDSNQEAYKKSRYALR